MNTWFLTVAHPTPSNILVLTVFLPSRMNSDQHKHLSFGCGALGCGDVDSSVFSIGDLANSCPVSSKNSMSPCVLPLQGKLTCLTWHVCDRVEEHFMCCGDFSIFGGGFGLLLNFLHALGQNVHVVSDCGSLNCVQLCCFQCISVQLDGFGSTWTFEFWLPDPWFLRCGKFRLFWRRNGPKTRLLGPNGPHLDEFLRSGQSSHVVSHLLLIAVRNVKACSSHFSILRTRWADQRFSVALGGPLHPRVELASDTKLSPG